MQKLIFLLSLLWPLKAVQAGILPLRLETAAGVSQPVMAYASPSLSKGCFTLTGLQLTGNATLGLKGAWHWGMRFEAQLHPVDVARLGHERVMADPFLLDTYIRSEPYRHLGLLTGPTYQFDKGKWWFAEGSVVAGLMQSKTPHQLHRPTYFMTGPEYFEISSAIDYGLAYGAEVSAGWKATPCYHLKLSASFFHTDMEFRFRTASGIRTDSRSISTLNFRAGVVFLLPPLSK
ncbi:MAG: hypothetical protein IPM52_09755 [Bacteroidetes bacterium]|nr:hypothetical protein [Bacteroidota bacterium]